MNLRLWSGRDTKPRDVFLALRVEPATGNISLRMVDDEGTTEPRGFLLTLTTHGALIRSTGIDRALAAEVGLQLDSQGRVKIEGE